MNYNIKLTQRKLYFFVSFIVICLLFSTIILNNSINVISKNNSSKTSNKKTISTKNYTILKNKLINYIKNKTGHYGIYFISLSTGKEFGINGSETFTAASTVKVPMNLYVFNKIAAKNVNQNELLTYTKNDYETGTGSLQYKSFGTKYPIKKLCELSLTQSDNVAINMLIHKFGLYNMKNYQASIVKHSIPKYENTASPKDMCLYLNEVLKFKNLHKNLGSQLLYNLEHTIFNDALPKYIPKSISVAHKIGTGTSICNDIGIIFSKHPYILAVMTKNLQINKEDSANEIIANISKMVYSFEK